jgi:hypothetical protein
MMKKLFLLGSCRIHRPFNCDKSHSDGKYNLYDCLNTRWYEKNFLGSLYCSNYITQTLKCLIHKNNKEYIQVKSPQQKLDNTHFNQLCETFYSADIIIIEIATIKYILKDKIYYSNEHVQEKNYNTLTRDELCNNIRTIEKLIKDIGKKVLFISHFNFNNIDNRKMIIECLNKTTKNFCDPTNIVISKDYILDNNHYTVKTEKIVMEKIHRHLSIM